MIVLLGSVIAFLSSKRQRSVFGAICLLYDCIAWQCNRPSALISQVEGSYPPDKSVKRVKGALHPNTLINTTQPLELPRQPHEEVRLRFRCPYCYFVNVRKFCLQEQKMSLKLWKGR